VAGASLLEGGAGHCRRFPGSCMMVRWQGGKVCVEKGCCWEQQPFSWMIALASGSCQAQFGKAVGGLVWSSLDDAIG
jgi:hypothetical protein